MTLFSAESPARARIIGSALLLAMFVAGGLAGAAFTRVLNAEEPAPAVQPGVHCHGPHDKGKRRGEWLKQLDLTPEQRVQVDRIMERRRAETSAFWDREGARLRAIVDSTRSEIRAVLTPAQRARYDELRAQHRAAHPHRGERRGEVPGGER